VVRPKPGKNQKLHGVSFATAAQIFEDQIMWFFVEPNSAVIHIISARKAVDYEESIYNDQFR
jgi:uncharacterized DUF497 family protein